MKKETNINEIILALDLLRSNNFYGGSECIEIAKGKNEIVYSWKGFITKIKRLIKAKK
tara:strand:- start:1491 stop:1664 length:174 start_codon:yes stop_codon:yes gene_type:complete